MGWGTLDLILLSLLEELESALLGLVACVGEVLQGLLAQGGLAAAYDTAVLVLHQVLLGQTTGGVVRSAVEHLGLGADGQLMAVGLAGAALAASHRVVLASVSVAAVGVHFLIVFNKITHAARGKRSVKGRASVKGVGRESDNGLRGGNDFSAPQTPTIIF
jgi:hypothetical protein